VLDQECTAQTRCQQASGSRASALPGGTVEEVGVEAVLQPEQHLGRFAVRITPPLRRDIGAVVAATRPPTGGAQALLDLLAADISSRGGQATKRPSGKTPPARPRRQQ
jgi:hypothetical protein